MKCKYCHAEIEQDAQFCTNCGKDLSMFDKCVKCGELLDNDSAFCPYCGTEQPRHEDNEYSEEKTSYKKIFVAVLGVLILGGLCYYYFSRPSKADIRSVNNNIVEKDVTKSDCGLKFEDMVPLIDEVIRDYSQLNQRVLEKSGMELKLIDVSDPGDGPSSEEVYLGMNVSVFPDGKDEYGSLKVKNVATDDYACVFSYWQETSSGAQIRFKRKSDAEDFMNQAKDYGLYEVNSGGDNSFYLIPKARLSGGGVKMVEFDYNLKYICGLKKEIDLGEDGWYVIVLPVDF